MNDLNSPLDFYKSTKTVKAGGLRRIVKQIAFLYYLELPLKAIHEYAAKQGYRGTYSSFTSWLRRNVDFDAEIRKHENEFRARDPRTPLSGANLDENSGTSGKAETKESEMFASRTQQKKSSTKHKKESMKGGLSPRDALEKWKKPSIEDQLDKHGIGKGKHDDEDCSS